MATGELTKAFGYDPNPAIVLVVRAPGGGPLDTSNPAVRREVDRVSREVGQVKDIGHVVNPLREPRAAVLLARDGHSLAITAHLDTTDIEDAGGIAAEAVAPIAASSSLDVAMGGFAAGFNNTNDQTRTDLTKAELIAFPILALLLLFVFRGVVAASIPLLIGVISTVGTLLALRIMSGFVDTSVFALNIATGFSLGLAVDYALLMVSRYREEIGREGATREAHRRTVQTAGPHGAAVGPDGRRGDGGADLHAAALPLLDGRRRRLGGGALLGDRDPRRALDAAPAGDPDRRPLDPPRRRRLRRIRRLVPARPRRHAAPGRGRPRQLGAAAGLRRAAAVDDPDGTKRRSGAAGPALLRRLQVPRRPLPARRHRGGHGRRLRARRPDPAQRLPAPHRSGRRGRARHPVHARAQGRGRLRQLRPRGSGAGR